MEKKKIAYIGEFKNNWNEEGIAKSFEKLGHEVLRIPEWSFRTREAVKEVRNFKPDFILVAKLKIPDAFDREDFINQTAEYQRITWNFDLYFGLTRKVYLRSDRIFRFDYFLSPDGGHDDKFKSAGVNHRLLRQGIFDEYCYRGNYVPQYDHDVVFVGTISNQWQYRRRLVKFLQDNYGGRFKLYGNENPNDIRGKSLNDLYASAKVVVGDSFYSPHYWSNRIYETLGRGGFFIHPLIEGIEKEYTPYKHFIPYAYEDFKGLKEKIDYFLTRPKERIEMGYRAMAHTKKHHTLFNRCQQLLEIIK